MNASRTAELTIRGAEGRMRVSVHWPASAGRRMPAPLVFFSRSWFGGASAEPADDALWGGLCSAAGLVALRVHRRESQGYDSALRDATTAIEWVADHAAELEADAGRLLVAGDGEAAGVVAEVVRCARDRGWPLIAHQVLVDPTDPRGPDRQARPVGGGHRVTTEPSGQTLSIRPKGEQS